jgi:hypothetical protein
MQIANNANVRTHLKICDKFIETSVWDAGKQIAQVFWLGKQSIHMAHCGTQHLPINANPNTNHEKKKPGQSRAQKEANRHLSELSADPHKKLAAAFILSQGK